MLGSLLEGRLGPRGRVLLRGLVWSPSHPGPCHGTSRPFSEGSPPGSAQLPGCFWGLRSRDRRRSLTPQGWARRTWLQPAPPLPAAGRLGRLPCTPGITEPPQAREGAPRGHKGTGAAQGGPQAEGPPLVFVALLTTPRI